MSKSPQIKQWENIIIKQKIRCRILYKNAANSKKCLHVLIKKFMSLSILFKIVTNSFLNCVLYKAAKPYTFYPNCNAIPIIICDQS